MNDQTPAPASSPKHQHILDRLSNVILSARIWDNPLAKLLMCLLGAVFFFFVISVPLTLGQQVVFGVICFACALVLRKTQGRLATIVMIMLSITASIRYMFWRLTETIWFDNAADLFFGTGLVLAELYALTVLLIGYFQTAWPLRRKPAPLPNAIQDWPSVDVFITTYNEPLHVVKQTVYTAQTLDWPADKINVYLLDDGRREAFKAFAEEVGVHYITRPDNQHAKAGNLNNALDLTSGEYIAVFDCDHVPTRSFLQISMGWFLKDKKLAMLQTPHFFFSPDPFEKNLKTFRVIPNEGELFYGVVQDGNDLWNATFFCGSCAVFKRDALVSIGGVATETVTEDAHTALKLNRAGYNTAYLAIPQAAGLATESLSAHIGQRIRWARGMAQIGRVDNPLLGKGLNFAQRLCYFNALMHFFYGLPRLIFLTAPLAYLFFGAHVFIASASMIAAFALPHLMHASITNSRMQGRFRHSFWNEVYESVLAWYIMRPVLTAFFINPKAGGFNVTAKGGLIEKSYFDWGIARPYIILLLLNLAGIAIGIGQLLFNSHADVGTLIINLLWTVYNIMMCAASLAVASESRQIRSNPRVEAQLQATLMFADGKTIACQTTDFSQEGLGLRIPVDLPIQLGDPVQVSLYLNNDEGTFPAVVAFRHQQQLGLRLDQLSVPQQVEFARLTFARADNWAPSWGHTTPDTPLMALKSVLLIGMRGMGILGTHMLDIFRPSKRTSSNESH